MLFLAAPIVDFSCGTESGESWTYIIYINEPPFGNWTYTRKPVNPMCINNSQIPIGANWTYVYRLTENHTYHAYCYGEWMDDGTTPQTDYDIYVYNPFGQLESYHTEAAGLPEHLGTTLDQPFFSPKHSGNYTFVIRNDPRESQTAEAATFMIIEHLGLNVWHSRPIEGKRGNQSLENTSWAYEFTADTPRLEIQVEVPETLDMYEARLYLMGNPSYQVGKLLNGYPLAWELGLYGETSGDFGGYNLESKGFRGNAYASCEDFGQDMLLNYTTSYEEQSLYHLVLIGELGSGNVSFRIKTDFGNPQLNLDPVSRVSPDEETPVSASSESSRIARAYLHHSSDNWSNSNIAAMSVNNQTCNGTIPAQDAGVTLRFRIEAFDDLDNIMSVNGSYVVKHPTNLDLTTKKRTVTLGENMSLIGWVKPDLADLDTYVKLVFVSQNGTRKEGLYLATAGNFSASLKPPFPGSWGVQAFFAGDSLRFESSSDTLQFTILEPSFLAKHSLFIYAGVGAAILISTVVFMLRRRE
jgi:hypothetical protein